MERDGQLLQAVLPADDARAAPPLQRRSLPGSADDEAELVAIVDELSDKPFQVVGAGVPLRVVLIAAGADDHVLFIGNHHVLRRAGSLSTAVLRAVHSHRPTLRRLWLASLPCLRALDSSACASAGVRFAGRLVQRRHQRRDSDV